MSAPQRLTCSVVVVTKDRPEQLAVLMESLARQTQLPDEVLVVDNNSSKSYQTLFDRYRDRLPLRTVVERTPGIPAARNRGIAEATGDIILFTDDDCEADANWVASMVRPFYQNPYIGAVGGEILSVRKAGTWIEKFCVEETLMRMGRADDAAHDGEAA